eukprot:2237686-Amphidinium_carterae.1
MPCWKDCRDLEVCGATKRVWQTGLKTEVHANVLTSMPSNLMNNAKSAFKHPSTLTSPNKDYRRIESRSDKNRNRDRKTPNRK